MNSNIYKTTYPSDRYGGNHIIGITVEFINLTKNKMGDENVQWSWYLIVDGNQNIMMWRDEDDRGRAYDGGCYYLTKDEYGHDALDEPLKDPEELDILDGYIQKEWPLQKREAYILKNKLSPQTAETFGDLIDEL
jgi:hypothetical protein